MQAEVQSRATHATTVRAEVSGWDRSGAYFVERTDVQVGGGRMMLRLQRAMAPHSVLFVRMLLAHGALEHESRLMQVTRSQKCRPSGYSVHCRTAEQRRKRKTTPGKIRAL